MFLQLLLIGVASPSSAFFFRNLNNCTNEEFSCMDGQCIPQRLQCDGLRDCNDSSDEEDCGLVNCLEPDYFRCKNRRCISSAFVCNDENDCEDYSDEVGCDSFKVQLKKNITCDSGMWQCTDKLCIPEEWVCNGEIDCLDGSDEGIGCSITIQCDGFKCKNHHCVPYEFRCDGGNDCNDNSDEEDCENHVDPRKCTLDKYQFLCSNNQTCIKVNEVCDGHTQCPDGSDEGPLCKATSSSCATHKCSHRCLQLPTGPKCTCPPGYHFVDEKTCEEINECKQYGICDQKCRNKVGSYECSCDPKYVLQDDKVTCKAVGGEAIMIFSSKSEIRGYLLKSDVYYPIARNLKQVVGVAFDGEHIFWSEIFSGHESIVKAKMDGSDREFLVTSGLGLPEDIAIDWLTRNIYFTDAEKQHIGVCNSDGTACTILINTDIRKPRAIVLNVNQGDMYWTDWGKPSKIGYSYMDGTNDKSFVSDNIHWPNGLALDIPNDRLYWTDARKMTLESINLDGTDRKIILKDIIKHPYAISVFENRLYWSDWETHSIQSCDKFTGKNHQTIIKEDTTVIYGLSIFHAAMETRVENPCTFAFCSDICLLSGTTYKCACPQNKVLGADKHKCREVERKQMLILGAQNMLISIEHQALGRHKVAVVPAAVGEVGALTYNSVNNTLYVSDLATKRILSVDLRTGVSKPLPISGLRKVVSMDYDPMGNNLYVCDEVREVVEVINLNTLSKKILLHDMAGEIPLSIALVPEEGVMFVALKKSYQSSHIDRFFMDGTGRTHSIDGGLSESISLHFDPKWYRILFADSDSGKIESTSVEGDDRFEFRSLSTSPVGISSLSSDIFWVNKHLGELYWAEKNSPSYLNQKIALNIANVEKIHITALTPRPRMYNSCHNVNGHCSHLCLMSQKRAVCACPIGMDLGRDNHTCSEHIECSSGEYFCYKSNQCILKSLVCDGRTDCSFGEDENGCAPPKHCDLGQFQCNNGDCIKEEQVCNHHFDCKDKSDEFNCNKNKSVCPPAHIQCGDSSCIPDSARCDSFKDCNDGSDELNCLTNTCDITQFRCKSGGCIPKSWECNNEFDCPDMSDEHHRCEYIECSPDMFKCRNKKCMDRSLTCDGRDDCGDNSDEESCNLNGKSRCGSDEFACTSNSSICLLKSARCNGTSECPHHEDEKDCSDCLIDEFECDNKKCISYQWLCDGLNDCSDNSDEKVDFCQSKKGMQSNKVDVNAPCNEFRCKSGHCVKMDLLCDGHQDCYDGSDEGGMCATACTAENHPCEQKCMKTPHGPACRCHAGYQLQGDERTCVDIDECAEDPPRCSQLCHNRSGSFSCDCYVGYVLRYDKISCKALGNAMSVIYIAENQVRELDQKSNSLRVLYSEEMPKITGIEMSMQDNLIYMSLENSQTIQKLRPKNKTIHYIENVGQPEKIALDWSTNNIYFYNAQTDSKSINVCNFEAMLCARVIDIDLHRQVSSLAVDSVNKFLFYTVVSWWVYDTPSFVIYKTNLDGTGRQELVGSSEGYITDLTFDLDSKQVYYIDQHLMQISTISYDGKMKQTLFTNITKGVGIKFFENHLYYLMTNGYVGKCQLYQPRACHHFKLHTYSDGLFLINQEGLQPKVNNPCLNHTCSYMCVLGGSGSSCICEDGTLLAEKEVCPVLERDSESDIKRFNFVKPSTEKSKSNKMVTALIISFFMIVLGVCLVYFAKKKTNGRLSMSSIKFINPLYNTPSSDEQDKPILIPGQHEYSNPVQTQNKSKSTPDTPDKELQKELIIV